MRSIYWGTRSELGEVLALAARGLITPEYRTYSLDQALDAYADMDAGRLTGRAVITP
jgi:propanol-preferring alcohol dehydrogenase